MLKLCLLVLAAAATTHAKAHGTSAAYYSPRGVTGYSRASYGGRYPYYGHRQYYYHHRQPTYSYKTPTYATAAAAAPAAAAATATTVVSDDHSGSSPWWNRYFPGAGLPDEREVFPEWFEVDDPEQCDNVPDSVNTGRPRDLCGDDDLNVRFCICMKRPARFAVTTGYGTAATTAASVYEPICGQCRDPCSLRFIPDTYPRRRGDDSRENDDDNDNSNSRRGNTRPRDRARARDYDDDDYNN